VCEAPLAPHQEIFEPVAVPSSEPEWRREVAHRLRAYRARRQRLSPDDSQAALFPMPDGPPAEQPARQRPAPRVPPRPRRVERVEIVVRQPELDFSAADACRSRPDARLVPVAEVSERFRAGLFDAFFLMLAYAGFLLLFGWLGGQLSWGKSDAVVYAVTFFLFYAQYFALFTAFDGPTPGMRLCSLSLVSFDGSPPSTRQLLWRSFGYLLSGGTMLLGFAWSLWDEDHLTWQDRISQTYPTRAR